MRASSNSSLPLTAVIAEPVYRALKILPRSLARLIVFGLLGLLPIASIAADAPTAPAAKSAPAPVAAPLKLENRTIFIFRSDLLGYSPEQRAEGASRRIEAVLAEQSNPKASTVELAEGVQVMLGDRGIFLVTPEDINPLASDTVDVVAKESAGMLDRAVAEQHEEHEPRAIGIAIGLSLLATLVFGLVVRGLIGIHRWTGRRLAPALADRSRNLHLRGVSVIDPSHVMTVARRGVTLLLWIVGLGVANGWLTFVLNRFAYTRPWGEELRGHLLSILVQVALAIVAALPGLVFVAVIVVIARVIIKSAAVFFDRVQKGSLELGWLDPDTVIPTRRIFTVLVWLFALAMAYPYLPGAQTEAFKGLSVLAGLMLSLGASSVIGQAANGLILMYNKAYRPGEYIRIGDNEGTVVELGMFSTRIRTGLGEEVMLPNSTVMASTTKNYSRAVAGTGSVVATTVTIGYSTPWRQVHAMLEQAALRTEDIAKTPEPFVRQTSLSDFYVEYRLVAYTPIARPALRIDVLNRLHANIQDVFNENGVQIMSPHYLSDPAEPQIVPKQDWYKAPASPPVASPGASGSGSDSSS